MTPPKSDTDDLPQDEALPGVDTQDPADAAEESTEEEEKPKLKLELKIDSPSTCERHVTVTIGREDVDRYLDDAYSELMPAAEVPGFRPGRAPRKLVEHRFKEQITNQVKGALLMDGVSQATEESGLSVISEPDIDFEAVTLPDEGPMTFEFDIEVRPDFTLPEWKGLKIEKPVRDFTDEDVDKHILAMRKRNGHRQPREGAIEAGDLATLSATFREDGRLVSRIEKETIEVKPVLSFADGKLEGFDELVTGARIGESRNATITLTQDAPNESLRGKEVEVEFQITGIERLEPAPLDADFLSSVGGFDSVEALREAVRLEMKRQLDYYAHRRVRQQITQLLVKTADWDLPPEMLRRQARRELERAVLELQAAGFGNEAIRAHENELRQNSFASTARALKEHFILERIAEDEKFDAEPADYDREIAMIAYQQGESPRRVRARLEKRGLMDTLHNQIVERKVIELITSHAKFKEVPFEQEPEDVAAVEHVVGGDPSAIPEAKHAEEAEALPAQADRT